MAGDDDKVFDKKPQRYAVDNEAAFNRRLPPSTNSAAYQRLDVDGDDDVMMMMMTSVINLSWSVVAEYIALSGRSSRKSEAQRTMKDALRVLNCWS